MQAMDFTGRTSYDEVHPARIRYNQLLQVPGHCREMVWFCSLLIYPWVGHVVKIRL